MTSDRGTSGESELQLDTPVTPKSPGLNPNATVFLSCKSGPGAPDTGQWEQQQQQQQQQQQGHSDSGIYLSSSSDYSFANGDVSVDKTDAAVFSPTSESTFQPEFSPQYTDNQAFPSDSNANIAAKLEDTIARHLSDDQDPLPGDAPPPATTLPDGSVPMTGENYSSDNSANASDGEAPAGDISVPESQLRLAIKNQLETYFSRENLSGDSYLQSQMDSDQYVPIATVASLDNIQRLTSDLRLIVELLRESTFVQVDEKGEKVRPNHNRCIVILREIPDTTPVEEVQGLFSGQNCPQFVSCEFAHNSNWYVTFESDADAHRAYLYLREDVKTFLGKPIMARIKAKPLIRAYTPKNGYMNKRYQPMMPQPSAPPLQEVPTSTAPQPQAQQQFSTTQPFALMPNVSQYHLNGQQAMPFYPPPNPLLQNWNSNTMLDPSMVGTVLALNGYQPTSVKVNPVANRAPYPTNINRNNIRNQNLKLHSRPMNQDRMPEPLPPRLSHQREQQQQQQMQQQQMQQQQQQQHSCNANMHKTSPRNAETTPISNHPSMYQTRRLENLNHPSHPPMPHSMQPHSHPPPHPPPPPPHVHQPLSQHVDNNANNNVLLSSRPPPPTDQLPLSQRYAGKSYKSRRRRDEDGARPPRPNSQTSPSIPEQRPYDKQFDYEPTNFPPLPGACNNATSGDVFENKLSDVVRGTAKPQVRDTPKAVTTATPSSTATTTSSSAPPSAIPATPHTTSKENKENIATSNHANVPVQQTSTPIPSQQTIPSSSGVTTSCQPSVSPVVKATEKPVQSIASELPAPKPVVVHTQSKILEEKPVASQVKLSYAQMVQRSRAAEGGADTGEGSDSDPETPLQHSNIANSIAADPALPTQSNSKSTSAISRSPAKEAFRKDRDFGTEEPREQPREQRVNNARRMKENRERRFDNRDTRDMRDRRVDRGGFERRDREREVPRTAVAK